MPYIILAFDYEDKNELREGVREEHRWHLRSVGAKLLASGALLDDSGENVIGGLSLLDTEDRSEAESFAYTDPYYKAGIRKTTQILKWRRRWINGEFNLK